MEYIYNNPSQKDLRKKLRNNLGLPEIILWRELKGGKLGKKFRRQYGVGKYSLDFYCPDLRLGIELDGSTHDNPDAFKKDVERENFIKTKKIKL